jgi:hypothetical protein
MMVSRCESRPVGSIIDTGSSSTRSSVWKLNEMPLCS